MLQAERWFNVILLCGLIIMVINSSVWGEEVVQGETAVKLDEYLTRSAPFGFSGAVLVASHDEVILKKGYGLADRDNNIRNTSETVFGVGALTMQFTAAAILKLEMDGLLKTVDPIGKHLDNVPMDKKIITIHHLLTHTSGLADDVGDEYDIAERDETVNKILNQRLDFFPGSGFEYSNIGYTLLAAIIEKVSGQQYEQYLNENLFQPSDMRFTGYRIPRWSDKIVARWYVGNKDNGTPLEKPYPYWNLIGNRGILSTTGDMFKWYQSLGCCAVLDEQARKKLYKPFLENYAYGWDVLDTKHGKLIQHNGGSRLGNSAEYIYYVDEGIFIMILCNQSFGEYPLAELIRYKIEDIIFGDDVVLPPEVMTVDISELEKFEGTFELNTGGIFEAVIENNALFIYAYGQDAVNVLAFPDDPDLARYSELNDKAIKVFQAAVNGDFKPLEKVLDDKKEKYESAKKLIEAKLEAGEERTGEIQRVISLGTLPSRYKPDAQETIIEIEGKNENLFFLSFWHEGKNIGIASLGSAQPVGVPFQMVSRKNLAGYHLGMSKVLNITFNVEGGCSRLDFTMGDGTKVEALRIEE
ncbi:beta-lactamase family protein [bacterium]|nr:beta-lactamase family protein [bacterium]